MSGEVPYPAQEASIEKRMRRWVTNDNVSEAVYFMPFAQEIVASLAHVRLVLALDSSPVGRGCMALLVGVIYQQRALPLAWLVYRAKKGHTTAAHHIAVLEAVRPLLPEGAEVVLLGDGEYDNVAMLRWIETHTSWAFVVRSAPNLTYRCGRVWRKIGELPLTVGSQLSVLDVAFTQAAYGPLLLVGWWDKRYQEPLYLLSNLSSIADACRAYRKRFRLETFFSDQKSRGFHIHQSHLADPARLSRLLIAACLAYIWMIALGLFVIHSGQRARIDRPDRRDKSLFRLGLDWLRYVLKWGEPFFVTFRLPSGQALHALAPPRHAPHGLPRSHGLPLAA